ncbi:MAG: hypothetical protein AABW47_00330 [Nanoarchaeota archaeon]
MGVIKKQNPDNERAKNLMLESEDKLKFFEKVKNKLGTDELNSNYIVETCYDILIELLRAKLLIIGYKTDSHEAEISYMRNLDFSENEVIFMNELRYFRNGIKYYGRILTKEYAEKVFIFMEKIYLKLKKSLK